LSTNFPQDEFIPDDWISQAEAARLRGVSRQAIAKLVRRGRLRAMRVGGHLLVRRSDVEHFTSDRAGRPRKSEPQGDSEERQ
jgi:excisionase family DNA binding protein